MKTRLLVLAVCLGAGVLLIGSSLAHVLGGAAKPKPSPTRPLVISPTGSDSGPCSAARPCQTFQRAFNIARPGQVVEVEMGSYPDQTISGTRGLPKVIFRPAAGASVSVNDIFIHASNLELRGFSTGYWASYEESNNLTMRNIDTGPFGIYGSSNTSVIGGDVGPSWGNGSPTSDSFISYNIAGTVPARNVVIDGTYFHDFKLGFPADHGQCLMVAGGDGITIRNSRFQRCDGFSIFFTQWAGPDPPKNILLENNFFDLSTSDGSYTKCCSYFSVLFSANMSAFENITVRYNSARQTIGMERTPPRTNVSFIGNLAPLGADACLPDVTYAYNIWFATWTTPAKCGRTDRALRVNDPGWVDAASLNLHLLRKSPAINGGDPKRLSKAFPKRDIDGQRRPMGNRADVGADESR